MLIIIRLITALGALTFSISFFLPGYFYNSPRARFLWAVDAAFPLGDWGLTLAFFGVAAVMAYPYIWGLMAAFTVLGRRERKLLIVPQIGLHIVAGVIIAVLGLVLLISGDNSLPAPALYIAVLFPPIFIVILFLVNYLVTPGHRGVALTITGIIPFIPLQLLIAAAVTADGGVSWGYYLGTAGAVICLLGCIFSLFKGRR
ncbi:MAG: hypothetical protein U9N73_05665 [Candidatus Auribacterota bacterium]|nr:hypothetical protein [Candidatus Auribacterota bacterium]